MFLDPAEILFGADEPDGLHECRAVVQRAAVLRRRPMLNTGWHLSFDIVLVDDRRNLGQVKQAVEEAGLLVGLGDFRPDYGRFVVKEWQPE